MNKEKLNKNGEKMDADDLSRIEQSLKFTDECGQFTRQASSSSTHNLTYDISHYFPLQPSPDLADLIDYRIKLLLSEKITIKPGECRKVWTLCRISRNLPFFTMFVKNNPALPLMIDSDVFIPQSSRGEYISLNVFNISNNVVTVPSGICVAYLHLKSV